MTFQEPIKRILVVDDDIELAKTITTHLRWEGYQVIHAGDGLEAKKMITAARTNGHSFDVVITDYLMPHSDGLELVDWIKQNHAEIFIIVMSGYLDHDTMRDNLRPEKDAYKIKPITPFDIETLLDRIKRNRKSAQPYTP
ncbi:MAG: response regulator [Proteobacteria bacterium]|nr:response regulator [Pseudomonadota bacterium]MBU1641632.1 response regulator [Pseudomonadota bacterium]